MGPHRAGWGEGHIATKLSVRRPVGSIKNAKHREGRPRMF